MENPPDVSFADIGMIGRASQSKSISETCITQDVLQAPTEAVFVMWYELNNETSPKLGKTKQFKCDCCPPFVHWQKTWIDDSILHLTQSYNDRI